MTVKQIKLNGSIIPNVELYTEEGQINPSLPQDLESFRKVTIDTLNWHIERGVRRAAGGQNKMIAANSKEIALIVKLLNTLNPDTSVLSELEKDNYEKTLQLAQNGYANSELLNNTLTAVIMGIEKYTELIEEALQAQTIEELVEILNKA